MSKIIKFIRITTGAVLMLVSSFGILFGIVAMIDPIGSKMADDSNPFGVPPSFIESLSLMLMYLLFFILGLWLVLGSERLIKLFRRKLK